MAIPRGVAAPRVRRQKPAQWVFALCPYHPSDILGLPAPKRFGPFLVVEAHNGVSLDFHDSDDEIASQHYAFLHLGDLPSVDEAVRLVHEALDAGVTFFGNCWEYYNGKTEDWLGQALRERLQ